MTTVCVSIVTFNNEETIAECLKAILNQQMTVNVTIVDNASVDQTTSVIRDNFPEVSLIENMENVGFARAHNQVLRHCEEPFALIINPDAYIEKNTLTTLMATMNGNEAAAIVAPWVSDAVDLPQNGFDRYPGILSDIHRKAFDRAIERRETAVLRQMQRLQEQTTERNWVTGACMLVRTESLREVGHFDERFFLYMEDVDLCRRMRSKGWKILLEPKARCFHRIGGSESSIALTKHFYRHSRLLYENKYGNIFSFYLYKFLRARKSNQKFERDIRAERDR